MGESVRGKDPPDRQQREAPARAAAARTASGSAGCRRRARMRRSAIGTRRRPPCPGSIWPASIPCWRRSRRAGRSTKYGCPTRRSEAWCSRLPTKRRQGASSSSLSTSASWTASCPVFFIRASSPRRPPFLTSTWRTCSPARPNAGKRLCSCCWTKWRTLTTSVRFCARRTAPARTASSFPSAAAQA